MNEASNLTEVETEDEQKQVANAIQFLSFILGNEQYAVDILRVQEIRSWEPVSRIPNVPSYEKGVVNLRGAIVPVIDLRDKFNLGHAEYTPMTVVVILQTEVKGKNRIMGVVVDAVSNVIDIDKTTIQSPPEFGTKVSTEYINGLAAVDEQMVMLLDVDKLLKLDDVDEEDES